MIIIVFYYNGCRFEQDHVLKYITENIQSSIQPNKYLIIAIAPLTHLHETTKNKLGHNNDGLLLVPS